MPCTSPRPAGRVNGFVRMLPMSRADIRSLQVLGSDVFQLPCGQCIWCRLEYAREWAVRMSHEALLHQSNSFITLTYDNDHLPNPPSLDLRDFQLFMKRLRKGLQSNKKNRRKWRYKSIRFFQAGEYGERFGRPHYHAAIFGFDFPDRVQVENTRHGFRQWESPMLNRMWGLGRTRISELNFETAAYMARYITKKVNGKRKKEHYERYDPITGEVYELSQEKSTMSRMPGLGEGYFRRFFGDIYPHDFVVLDTKRGAIPQGVPRYYDKLLRKYRPDMFECIKEKRAERSLEKDFETDKRLGEIHQVLAERLKIYSRDFEIL